jgi:hypothetical protein
MEKTMTKSTEEMSKELHDWLSKPGECWHEWDEKADDYICTCGMELGSATVLRRHIDRHSFNFFSPATEDQAAINFFWLWDRVKENYEEYMEFIFYVWGWGFEKKKDKYLSQANSSFPTRLISCTELAKALYEFKEGQ